MDIQENNVIGNFIYGLGWEMRGRGVKVDLDPVSINLLQQGSLDPTMGDVLIANAKVVRLVEFKRELKKARRSALG